MKPRRKFSLIFNLKIVSVTKFHLMIDRRMSIYFILAPLCRKIYLYFANFKVLRTLRYETYILNPLTTAYVKIWSDEPWSEISWGVYASIHGAFYPSREANAKCWCWILNADSSYVFSALYSPTLYNTFKFHKIKVYSNSKHKQHSSN